MVNRVKTYLNDNTFRFTKPLLEHYTRECDSVMIKLENELTILHLERERIDPWKNYKDAERAYIENIVGRIGNLRTIIDSKELANPASAKEPDVVPAKKESFEDLDPSDEEPTNLTIIVSKELANPASAKVPAAVPAKKESSDDLDSSDEEPATLTASENESSDDLDSDEELPTKKAAASLKPAAKEVPKATPKAGGKTINVVACNNTVEFNCKREKVYDSGSLCDPEILDITDDDIKAKFMAGVANVAALSLAI
jgi:hypothetical protein